MRRYLTISEAEAALNRGKQIEQFLNGFLQDNAPAIRYIVIRLSKHGRIAATVYECFEPENTSLCDVGEFQPLEPDTDPKDFFFDTLKEAVVFLEGHVGASDEKYVNQGMVDDEYRLYREAKRNLIK